MATVRRPRARGKAIRRKRPLRSSILEDVAIRQAPKRALRLEEFLELPETEPASELIHGEVVQKPVAKIPHNWAVRKLIRALDRHPYTSDGTWLTEQGLSFPATTPGNHRVPDLSWFRAGRVSLSMVNYLQFAPDLAVEVRSEGQSLAMLREKLSFLREQGTTATLLVDPVRRTVEVDDAGRRITVESNGTITLDSIGGFTLSLADLFAE